MDQVSIEYKHFIFSFSYDHRFSSILIEKGQDNFRTLGPNSFITSGLVLSIE